MKLLTTKQYKLSKGEKAGILTAGITLSPANEASLIMRRTLPESTVLPSTCPMSGACESGCLKFAGMNQYPTHAIARARRTALWFENRATFLSQALSEFVAVERKAHRLGYITAARPNLLSDIPQLAHALAAALPAVRFYDYTKIPGAWKRVKANYHLTYSASERSTAADIRESFAHGINVAVVVSDIAKGEKLPATFTLHGITRPTIDGDINDARFLDAPGHYVLLRWKGSKARLAAAAAAEWARPTIALTLVP